MSVLSSQLVDQNVEDENFFSNGNTLSDSTYVPIKTGSANGNGSSADGVNGGNSHGNGTGGQVSGAESDDSASIRSVRFSKLAEVREMSPHDATEALMSRLSYAASMRIRRQKTNHKTARTALMFCILVIQLITNFNFCIYHLHTKCILILSICYAFIGTARHSGLSQIIYFNWHSNRMKRHWSCC